mmetsp:Transcript_14383/g.31485  ORF Transcript_14383/g.31485 Transcript_14383/m.31485 type:complete len:200 (-) Transcript_14383:116-715(-)
MPVVTMFCSSESRLCWVLSISLFILPKTFCDASRYRSMFCCSTVCRASSVSISSSGFGMSTCGRSASASRRSGSPASLRMCSGALTHTPSGFGAVSAPATSATGRLTFFFSEVSDCNDSPDVVVDVRFGDGVTGASLPHRWFESRQYSSFCSTCSFACANSGPRRHESTNRTRLTWKAVERYMTQVSRVRRFQRCCYGI